MNTEPVTTALRAISETKQLLELLLTSSETFDYGQARQTLRVLGRKVRELGKLQSRLNAGHKRKASRAANVLIVDFRNAPSPKDSRAR